MTTAHEHFSQQFHAWELRGRGWKVFEHPVSPEPPFVPFSVRMMTETPAADDGRRPTFFSSLAKKLTQKPKPEETPEEIPEPAPVPLNRDALIEFQASLPDKLDVSREEFEQFLSNLSLCHEPVAFELLGVHKKVTAQFVAAEADAPLLRRQLQAYFSEAVFTPAPNGLESAWNSTTGEEMLAVEFGLAHEFMLPLVSGKLDPFIGIIGALSELQPGELGLFQVLWQSVQNPWAEAITDSVCHGDGKPFFVNAPELTGGAESKVSRPLYAAVVRIMVCAEAFDRVLQLSRDLAGSLRIFSHPSGNSLIPLNNDVYPFEDHIVDVLRRQTRRTGMLLNSDELIGFAHLPSSAVRSRSFQRQSIKSKAAPGIVRQPFGLLLGNNSHAGETVEVRLSSDQRVHHTHIIGASGTGKSTLMFNLIQQAVECGEGIAVLDPHGDLIERILENTPKERIDDVIFVNPADDEYSIGFNILSAHSELEKTLLASDLIATFQRLSTSWGDQMNSVLQNAILAFLENDRPGTIADLRRFLIEPAFKSEILKSVRDPEIVYYWQKSFPHLPGNKSIGSILTRLDTFLAQKPIRHMVSQPENKLDFAHIMDTGKILLAKLPEGLLGRENSFLLGTLMVSKFQQIAMSRQAQRIESRRLFNIYIDEFANFITPSMAEILTGARKYRIGLTLAHHELHQLQRSPEVASAVMTHPFARVVFRVGDDDAKKLADGFSFFEAQDLRNLDAGQAIARVERSDFDFNLTVPLPSLPNAAEASARKLEVITASRKRYATARAEVEALLAKSRENVPPSPSSAHKTAVVKETQAARVAEVPPLAPPDILQVPMPPMAVEVPKPEPEPSTPKHSPPRDLGRGGSQHQAVQKRIKEAAEALGFRGVIEKQVSGTQKGIDLLLERANQRIACEISFSTTIDHEVGNVMKCLDADIPKVAVICLDDERVRKIGKAVAGSLGADLAARVMYFQPDSFIAYLKSLQSPEALPTETTFGGYKIKRSIPKLSVEEQRQKEDIANRAMLAMMQKKK